MTSPFENFNVSTPVGATMAMPVSTEMGVTAPSNISTSVPMTRPEMGTVSGCWGWHHRKSVRFKSWREKWRIWLGTSGMIWLLNCAGQGQRGRKEECWLMLSYCPFLRLGHLLLFSNAWEHLVHFWDSSQACFYCVCYSWQETYQCWWINCQQHPRDSNGKEDSFGAQKHYQLVM